MAAEAAAELLADVEDSGDLPVPTLDVDNDKRSVVIRTTGDVSGESIALSEPRKFRTIIGIRSQ